MSETYHMRSGRVALCGNVCSDATNHYHRDDTHWLALPGEPVTCSKCIRLRTGFPTDTLHVVGHPELIKAIKAL